MEDSLLQPPQDVVHSRHAGYAESIREVFPASLEPRAICLHFLKARRVLQDKAAPDHGRNASLGAAARYGVDPMRLYYCHVGSPHVDIEWDPEIVLDYRRHLERALRACDEGLAAERSRAGSPRSRPRRRVE